MPQFEKTQSEVPQFGRTNMGEGCAETGRWKSGSSKEAIGNAAPPWDRLWWRAGAGMYKAASATRVSKMATPMKVNGSVARTP